MFNTKNLLILFIAGPLAAFITQATPVTGLGALFMSSFLALIIMLIAQSISAGIKTSTPGKTNSKGKSAQSASSPSDPNRESGTVKWFDSNKGYGFITRSMGEDIFVHFRSIKGNGYRSLHEGQSVEFLVTKGSKGPQAEDIKVLN